MNVVAVKRGRPPKFKDEYPGIALHLCRLGATNRDLAKAFGVSVACIDRWIVAKPAFAEQVKNGRELADGMVATALFQRAIGAVVPDTHVSVFEGVVTITALEKHFPPDTAACSLWLRNRRPDLWREKTMQAVEIANGDNPYHEAALRIMQADRDRLQSVYEDELARMQAGQPTVIPEGEPKRVESPLHDLVGLGPPHTDSGAREFAQMLIIAERELGFRDGAAIEAEIIPSKPALPPEIPAERVPPVPPVVKREPEPEPEPATESSEDFRALLGLPAREE